MSQETKKYTVEMAYPKQPNITVDVFASNEAAAKIMAQEKARQSGWTGRAKSVRVVVRVFLKEFEG